MLHFLVRENEADTYVAIFGVIFVILNFFCNLTWIAWNSFAPGSERQRNLIFNVETYICHRGGRLSWEPATDEGGLGETEMIFPYILYQLIIM